MSMASIKSLLFSLPKYVLLNFCSEWMSVRDLCKLDNSMTNFAMRLMFDSYLSSGKLLICYAEVALSEDYFNWLINKNFTIKTLRVVSTKLPTKEFILSENETKIFKCLRSIAFVDKSVGNVKQRKKINFEIFQSGCHEAIIQSCLLLETLDISYAGNNLSEKFFQSVAHNCPFLKRFIIGRAFQTFLHKNALTADTVVSIITQQCYLLEEITCDSHISNEVIIKLSESCKHLKKMVCRPFTYNPSGLSTCAQYTIDQVLTALSINFIKLEEFCVFDTFTDVVLCQFLCGCKYLTSLSFDNCTTLSDTSLLAIIAANCRYLTGLDMKSIVHHSVTVPGITYSLNNCPTITHLSLPQQLSIPEIYSLFSVNKYNLRRLEVKVFYPSHFGSIMVQVIDSKMEQLQELLKPCECIAL